MTALPPPQTHNLLPPAPLKIEGALLIVEVVGKSGTTSQKAFENWRSASKHLPTAQSIIDSWNKKGETE